MLLMKIRGNAHCPSKRNLIVRINSAMDHVLMNSTLKDIYDLYIGESVGIKHLGVGELPGNHDTPGFGVPDSSLDLD